MMTTIFSSTRVPVESSLLRSIGYNRLNQHLEIEFLDGSIYEYRNVPLEAYLALMDAPSKSSYFQFYIAGKYPRREIH